MKYQSIYIAAALAASSYAKTVAWNVEVEPEAPLEMIHNFSHEVLIQEVLEAPRADTQLLRIYHTQNCDGKAIYSIAGDGENTKADGLTPVYDGSYYQQYFYYDFSVELPPRTLLQIYHGVPYGKKAPELPNTLFAS